MTLPPNAPSALVQLLFRPITTAAAATHVADLPPLPLLLQGEERRTPSSKTALPNPSRSSHLAKCGFVTFPSPPSHIPIIMIATTKTATDTAIPSATTPSLDDLGTTDGILPIPSHPRHYSSYRLLPIIRRPHLAPPRKRIGEPNRSSSIQIYPCHCHCHCCIHTRIHNRKHNPNTSTGDRTPSVPPLPSTPLERAASRCHLR
mmetsp:Transcript_850/g.1669  ORF Transcript_850/g.1669 Transcript_850/m.1669 type:complete len:203 (-) Transcript_850:388-996(-)